MSWLLLWAGAYYLTTSLLTNRRRLAVGLLLLVGAGFLDHWVTAVKVIELSDWSVPRATYQ